MYYLSLKILLSLCLSCCVLMRELVLFYRRMCSIYSDISWARGWSWGYGDCMVGCLEIEILLQYQQLLIIMKESSCGRIISQRKLQTSLLKQYDTKHTINFTRIDQLKKKYTKADQQSDVRLHPQTRSPLLNILNNAQVNQSTYVSDFANQIKSKYIQNNNNAKTNVGIVANVGHEGREKGGLEVKKEFTSFICQYKKKVEITDDGISRKLDDIQQQILMLKNQREIKENEKIRQINQLRQLERIRQTQQLIQIQKRRLQSQKQIEQSIKLPQSIKISQIQQDYQYRGELQKQIERSIVAKIDAKLLKRAQEIDESKCKLLGQFRKQRVFSHQFTIFINRLKDQISLDVDFTLILLSLPRTDRDDVKNYIRKYHSSADLQFFHILPFEQDPLQNQARVSYNGSIPSIAEKLYEFYVKIEDHYKLKLANNFQLDTIQTLFWEIGEKQMTLGHLISYVNMRTGKDFRNRALVKLLRRLGIPNHHIIDLNTLTKKFVKF